MTRHPAADELALYAGGDLGWRERWRIARHQARCARCREEIAAFERARGALRDEADRLPAQLDWDRLAAEMNANIHLGLAAGECVAAERPRRRAAGGERLSWRAAMALAMMTLVILTGWFLNAPRPRIGGNPGSGFVLEADSAGIGLKENGRALTVLHPGAANVTYSADAQGSLRARYVDIDTGQVTITNVYAE